MLCGNIDSGPSGSSAFLWKVSQRGDSLWTLRLKGFISREGRNVIESSQGNVAAAVNSVNGNDTTAQLVFIKTHPVAMAGFNHILFVDTHGMLYIIGFNSFGELGKINHSSTLDPVMTDVQIAGGTYHTLILKNDGTLLGCGYNSSGQLGDGTQTSRDTPVKIMTSVKSFAAGRYHSLILKTGGTLWAGGENDYVQLGDGTNENRTIPVQIMTEVQSISAGVAFSLILKTDGTVWACGDNRFGQLGDGTTTNRYLPVQIMTGVRSISAGSYHSLILKTDGTLRACGYNIFGRLGDGTTTGRLSSVMVMTGVEDVAASCDNSMMIKIDGMLWICGNNNYGQFGDGTVVNHFTPVNINFPELISPVIHSQPLSQTIYAGDSVTFSFVATGNPATDYYWKKDGIVIPGACGSSYSIEYALPENAGSYTVTATNLIGREESYPAVLTVAAVPIITTQPSSKAVFSGSSVTFSVSAVSDSAPSYQWKKNGIEIVGATNSSFTISSISAGDAGSYTAVVSNSHGSVETNSATLTILDKMQISAGNGFSLFLNSNGTLFGCGLIIYVLGEVIDLGGTPTPRMQNVQKMDAGFNFSPILKADNTLWAFGLNDHGQLGDGTTIVHHDPVQVMTGEQNISAGHAHSLVLKTDGTLWACGDNSYGQLGDGTSTGRFTPVKIMSDVRSVSVGAYYSLILKNDITLWACGDNGRDQLGDGTVANRFSPV